MSYREEEIIEIFERNTNSVANVFDITLQVVLQAVSGRRVALHVLHFMLLLACLSFSAVLVYSKLNVAQP